ncbi:MAG TPA: hypothetical protein PLW02_07160, partial [Verrucomicrobiota bacterium]|nr:hypothetical protein [Verrucomicrobiota bacterium]
MLGRYRQLRKRLHQVADAGLFAVALYVAHFLRATWTFGRPEIYPFSDYLWLFIVILPLTPIILDLQGFYDRPLLSRHRQIVLPLARTSLIMSVVMIFTLFIAREQLARSVFFLFCPISFLLVLLKEEFLRFVYLSRFGIEQVQQRAILAGAPEDIKMLKERLRKGERISLKVVSEIDLNRQGVDEL